jgi:hypothetical protein
MKWRIGQWVISGAIHSRVPAGTMARSSDLQRRSTFAIFWSQAPFVWIGRVRQLWKRWSAPTSARLSGFLVFRGIQPAAGRRASALVTPHLGRRAEDFVTSRRPGNALRPATAQPQNGEVESTRMSRLCTVLPINSTLARPGCRAAPVYTGTTVRPRKLFKLAHPQMGKHNRSETLGPFRRCRLHSRWTRGIRAETMPRAATMPPHQPFGRLTRAIRAT